MQAQLESITAQKDQLQAEQDKLVAAEQKLTAKIESFRVRKETIKAQYTAAEAQTKIGEAFSGISEDMADVGMAMDRAENKVQTMQARAGAIDELLESGALDDLTRRAATSSTASSPRSPPRAPVDADLERLKGAARLGHRPGRRDLGGYAVIVRVLGHGQFRLDDADMATVEARRRRRRGGDRRRRRGRLPGRPGRADRRPSRASGDAVPDDEFVASDVIVPDRDITLAEARTLESEAGEGLIPG